MAETILQESKCAQCDALLLEPTNEERVPCPVCSGLGRRHELIIEESIAIHDHMRMKGKHGGKGKPFIDTRVGANFYYKGQEWHHLERTIDRDNNLYTEKITRISTGEVIVDVSEPLTQHFGHGDAKYRKDR